MFDYGGSENLEHYYFIQDNQRIPNLYVGRFSVSFSFRLRAICINQDSEKEKAIQASLLWKLLGDAESVSAYLGETYGYTKIAAAAFSSLSTASTFNTSMIS